MLYMSPLEAESLFPESLSSRACARGLASGLYTEARTGDAAACSYMATDISRVYSDLTHAVTLTTHGRSLTRAFSLTHTIPFTHAGALTRGVSLIQGGSHTRAVSLAHAAPLTRGASFTQTVSLTHTRPLLHTVRWEARTPTHS